MGDVNVDSIFGQAVELADDAARSEFVDQACGDDAALQSRVRQLLNAHFAESAFMNKPAGRLVSTDDVRVRTFEMGAQIGAYKIRELLGEGGMGEVYVAEQTEPVRRKVALKIIRSGMATKDVVARFEAERQALAMMDHPNIAKVFDGGSTKPPLSPGRRGVGGEGAGQPYFVMELVLGVPITDYCDEHQLTTGERLELFLKICQAVHHAHQKGIIHRDIKPGNVLVAEIDGAAVPKVIDFGVAKAIDQKLSKNTIYTNVAQMIGTPLYMSPEQATLGVADVDTRSDVYSLGVLLYELLTGQTPFDRDTLKQAAFGEMQRIIREDEPPRPSTRISTLKAEALSTISAKRRSDARRLGDSLRGELDWIVMKCLDKNRNRRYGSAADLSRDIKRYLADEPINARRPSRTYRMRKFIRRHRIGFLAAGAVLSSLIVGMVFAAAGFARAVAERDRATTSLGLVCELIDNTIEPAVWEMSHTPHVREVHARLLNQSVDVYEKVHRLAPNDPAVRFGLARMLTRKAHRAFNEGGETVAPARRAVRLLEPLVEEHSGNVKYRRALAKAHSRIAAGFQKDLRYAEAVDKWARSIDLIESELAKDSSDKGLRGALAGKYSRQAFALMHAGRLTASADRFEAGLNLIGAVKSNDLPFIRLELHNNFGQLLMKLGRFDDAFEHLHAASRLAADQLAAASNISNRVFHEWWIAYVARRLGELGIYLRQPAQAEQRLAEAIDRMARVAGEIPENDWMGHQLGFLNHLHGLALTSLDRTDEAITAHERAVASWRASGILGDLYNAGEAHWRIGDLHYAEGRQKKGDEHLERALREFETIARRLPNELFAQERLIVFLCACPNAQMRDGQRAVHLAQRIIVSSDAIGPIWRYLGLARWRTGDWAGAETAVRKCMETTSGGDAIDLLILAAAQAGLGKLNQARATFATAERAISDGQPIYYGTIGVIGFQALRTEIRQLVDAPRPPARHAHDFTGSPVSE